MLDPPYILNLTNISINLQVNYCLVKQLSTFFLSITRTEPNKKIEIILFLKKQHNLKFAPFITYCFRYPVKTFVFLFFLQKLKTENQIIGFNNTCLHISSLFLSFVILWQILFSEKNHNSCLPHLYIVCFTFLSTFLESVCLQPTE
jgi:hypothetical protein